MNMRIQVEPPAGLSRAGSSKSWERRKITAGEYWQMSEWGYFADQRVELIGGEIIQMPAQGNRHTAGITLVCRALDRIFTNGYWVRNQGTLNLSQFSVPDPDVAVIVGDPAKPDADVPTSALLIVEVSLTTLSEDRRRKGSLYAAAGIADYWILNLEDDVLEIRRDPRPDATQEFGHGYGSLSTLRPGDFAAPLAAPAARVPVADLMPH